MRRALVLAALIAFPVVACRGAEEVMSGIVVKVDSGGVGQVRGFTLLSEDGALTAFVVDGGVPFDGGAFPPDHLWEHMAMVEGIAVAYRTEGDRRIVLRLTDAIWAAP